MENRVSNVVELRQYTLHPGRRDELIELFDREFVETQEAEGIEVIGQFRDLGDPDRFVWFRGFSDMASRKRALSAFYGGPVWRAHRDAANATMIDSDNVLLLRPAQSGSGFSTSGLKRAPVGAHMRTTGALAAVIMHLAAPADDPFLEAFRKFIEPALARIGAPLFAVLTTETAENDFPALPIRAGENVLVWITSETAVDALDRWPTEIAARFLRRPEVLRLAPTARSRLRL